MDARLIVLAAALLLSGCAGSNCGGWSAIYPSRSDVLSEGTADQILKHNSYGASQCGWKPSRR